jgi:lysophospholipase L1-like esterase
MSTLTAPPDAGLRRPTRRPFARLVAVGLALSTAVGALTVTSPRADAQTATSGNAPTLAQQLVNDMTLPHTGVMEGVPTSYNWGAVPRIGMGNDPRGYTASTAWGQVYAEQGGARSTNTRVAVRNIGLAVLSKRTGRWTVLQDATTPQGGYFAANFVGNATTPGSVRKEADGSISVVPGNNYNFHFWAPNRVAIDPSDIGGIVSWFESRLVLNNPSGVDDRAQARFLPSAGIDYWSSMSSSWNNLTTNGDAAIGRARWATSQWQLYTTHTLTAAQINSNPPPIPAKVWSGSTTPTTATPTTATPTTATPTTATPTTATPTTATPTTATPTTAAPSTAPSTTAAPSPTVPDSPQPPTCVAPRPWRVMPLGDSLTSGGSSFVSYRGALEQSLRNAGYSIDFVGRNRGSSGGGTDIEHEGWGGYTIGPDASTPGNISSIVERALATNPPDAVTLLVGINDQFRSGVVNPATSPDRLDALVRRIQQLRPGVRIYLAGLAPVQWSDPWPTAAALNTKAKSIADADANDRIFYVDLPSLRPEMTRVGGWTSDKLHLNDAGARLVAGRFHDRIVATMPRSSCEPAPTTGTTTAPPTTATPTTATPTTATPTTATPTTAAPTTTTRFESVTPTTVTSTQRRAVVPATGTVRLQAEDAPVRHNLLVEPPGCDSRICGTWQGRGFLGEWRDAGGFVEVPISSPRAGSATLTLRYAAGTGTAQRVVSVDGRPVTTVSLSGTSRWSTWSTATVTVPVPSGDSVVRLATDNATAGRYVNLDAIEIGLASAPVPSVTPNQVIAALEAEDSPVRHNVLVEPPGCDNRVCGTWTGRGFLGEWRNAGEFVEVPVQAPAAGTYNLVLRYSAGSGAATRQVTVNGNPAPVLTFPRTSAWNVWQTVSVPVTLTAGANVVRLSTDGGNAGVYVNLDRIELRNASTMGAPA